MIVPVNIGIRKLGTTQNIYIPILGDQVQPDVMMVRACKKKKGQKVKP